MIPSDPFTQIPPREDDENTEGDDFLDDFQLKRREFGIADAIRWDLKTVFQERDQPAYDDHGRERSLAVFEVAIPSDGHEEVRTNKQQDCFHGPPIVLRVQY